MKVNLHVVSTKPTDIRFTGITLLSEEEYKKYKDFIPAVNYWWWLRSPGSRRYGAALVRHGGSLRNYSVDIDVGCVRPALLFNPKSSNLPVNSQFDFVEYGWTVIDDGIALCNEAVGQTVFRRNWQAPDVNDYEKSDIKKWLKKWVYKNGIVFEGVE